MVISLIDIGAFLLFSPVLKIFTERELRNKHCQQNLELCLFNC